MAKLGSFGETMTLLGRKGHMPHLHRWQCFSGRSQLLRCATPPKSRAAAAHECTSKLEVRDNRYFYGNEWHAGRFLVFKACWHPPLPPGPKGAYATFAQVAVLLRQKPTTQVCNAAKKQGSCSTRVHIKVIIYINPVLEFLPLYSTRTAHQHHQLHRIHSSNQTSHLLGIELRVP